jgi:hypothetical protein
MQKTCIECGRDFEAPDRINARSFCDATCRARHDSRTRSIEQGTFTGVRFPPRADGCLHCGCSMDGRTPQARYCSDQCRYDARTEHYHEHKLDGRELTECAFLYCSTRFVSFGNTTYCSKDCRLAAQEQSKNGDGAAQSNAIRRGLLKASRVYFDPCVDCNKKTCSRQRKKRQVLCRSCRAARNKRRDAFKNHRRRGSSPDRPLSVYDIAKRDGTRCHICHRKVDMTLSGLAKWGPTTEHIICITWDSDDARDTTQHVLAHRFCNLSRNNKKPSQMVLPLGA